MKVKGQCLHSRESEETMEKCVAYYDVRSSVDNNMRCCSPLALAKRRTAADEVLQKNLFQSPRDYASLKQRYVVARRSRSAGSISLTISEEGTSLKLREKNPALTGKQQQAISQIDASPQGFVPRENGSTGIRRTHSIASSIGTISSINTEDSESPKKMKRQRRRKNKNQDPQRMARSAPVFPTPPPDPYPPESFDINENIYDSFNNSEINDVIAELNNTYGPGRKAGNGILRIPSYPAMTRTSTPRSAPPTTLTLTQPSSKDGSESSHSDLEDADHVLQYHEDSSDDGLWSDDEVFFGDEMSGVETEPSMNVSSAKPNVSVCSYESSISGVPTSTFNSHVFTSASNLVTNSAAQISSEVVESGKDEDRQKNTAYELNDLENCDESLQGSFDFHEVSNPQSDANHNLKHSNSAPLTLSKTLDDFGFFVGHTSFDDIPLSGSGQKPNNARDDIDKRRQLKWDEMINKWDRYDRKKKKKIKRRARKSIPNEIRGRSWVELAKIEQMKLEAQQPGRMTYAEYLKSGISPAKEAADIIERDINRTFPTHIMFANVRQTTEDGSLPEDRGIFFSMEMLRSLGTAGLPSSDNNNSNDSKLVDGQTMLRRVLRVYSIYDRDVGYCQGMSFITAMFLMYMSEEDTFWMLVRKSFIALF
uniref:Rab-GAP TBC domain-containing protein n=1 Tax=Corethron hystrix TaxID=216773 RepID=A0A7S1BC73_9STRA|mmetsp:Transcript_20211/g.45812  ORF Transcript_20211/g.45812 Transcript_20211/m.45812 type:complete len:650 (+) Transcript_20211:176-2125(+)